MYIHYRSKVRNQDVLIMIIWDLIPTPLNDSALYIYISIKLTKSVIFKTIFSPCVAVMRHSHDSGSADGILE